MSTKSLVNAQKGKRRRRRKSLPPATLIRANLRDFQGRLSPDLSAVERSAKEARPTYTSALHSYRGCQEGPFLVRGKRNRGGPLNLECGGKVRSELASVGRRHRFCIVLWVILRTGEKRCRRASLPCTRASFLGTVQGNLTLCHRTPNFRSRQRTPSAI
jgi:hypothetical protein